MAILFQERAIDWQFASFICRESGGTTSHLFRLLVSLLSSAVGRGNICLDLADCAGQTLSLDGKEIVLPDVDALVELLRSMPTVGLPGQHRPLVLDVDGRLYLYRYGFMSMSLPQTFFKKPQRRQRVLMRPSFRLVLRDSFPFVKVKKMIGRKRRHRLHCIGSSALFREGPVLEKPQRLSGFLRCCLSRRMAVSKRLP